MVALLHGHRCHGQAKNLFSALIWYDVWYIC